MKGSVKDYKRIVVKIGSSLFYDDEQLNELSLLEIVSHASDMIRLEHKEIIIVSSGAIALGMNLLNLKSRPRELPSLQAAAAVGQNALMDNYSRLFKNYKINCAQVLLTWDDFVDRKRYLNAKNTLLTLLKFGSLPIVNENDTVSTEEIKFGDNDRLSALVATLVNADLLVILSDIDGLLGKDKKVIKIVDEITSEIKALACPTTKKSCVGGMVTKIEAAKIAVDSGIPCVIANGRSKDSVYDSIKNPLSAGTLFVPKEKLAARERWIAFGTKPKGKVLVDDGAKRALLSKKSLLSVGVVGVEGNFEAGDVVSVLDRQGREFARGKAGLGSRHLEKIKGVRFDREIIHCDNIVIL